MKFHDILVEFRALGGVAENLTLRHGSRGRGLFAVNPSQSVRLEVPAHLLVSPDWVVLDGAEHLRVAAKAASHLSAQAIAFFEQYQRHVGWGDGGMDAIRQHQLALQALPPKLKNFLHILGGAQELTQQPTARYCLQKYCVNRQISIKSASRLMPIAELINHSPVGLPYVVDEGRVTVTGMVKDEVLTRYHSHLDAFHFFVNYHFATPAHTALSCEVTVEVSAVGTLSIARMDHLADIHGKLCIPKISKNRDKLHLSFVEIANKKSPSQPRKTFAHLMATQHVPASVANALFDGLVEHNRQVLAELIQECQRHPGEMTSCLQQVASYQLSAID